MAQSQGIADGYMFIFYVLFGINFVIMIPTWCHYFSASSLSHSDLSEATPRREDQRMKGNDWNDQSLIHGKLLKRYLVPYLLATCADWLQGPYKYALYSSYGYTQRDIAHLFVAGYGSGMVIGSIIGGLADKYGRKRLCLVYCLAYTFSVLMKHCKLFYVLLLGRIGGGIATSLLFSVFESWLICAHRVRGLGHASGGGVTKQEEEKWLAKSLSASMYGSSLVAIGSGVLANVMVESSGKMRPWNGNEDSSIYVGGCISAFDACLLPLVLCATLILVSWEENYGHEAVAAPSNSKEEELVSLNGGGIECHTGKHSDLKEHLSDHPEHDGATANCDNQSIHNDDADLQTLLPTDEKDVRPQHDKERIFSALFSGMHTVYNSPRILRCCIIGSVFEGAMYIFIFLWTPALTALQGRLSALHDHPEDEVGIGDSTQKEIHTGGELPFGWIFSTFMVCCMLGAVTFSRLFHAGVPATTCLTAILALSSLSCLAMAWPHFAGNNGAPTTSSANTPQYIGMLVYEFCVGFYYPAMGTVKGTIVPEHQRAAIYNVFRLPLNLLVLTYLMGDFSTSASFSANAALLLVACVLQLQVVGRDSGGVGIAKSQ